MKVKTKEECEAFVVLREQGVSYMELERVHKLYRRPHQKCIKQYPELQERLEKATRKWAADNPERVIELRRKGNEKRKQKNREAKMGDSCKFCGSKDDLKAVELLDPFYCCGECLPSMKEKYINFKML